MSAGFQVPPLWFSRNLQGKLSALSTRLYVERGIYHNGRSFEVLREEVVEAHGGLAVHCEGINTWGLPAAWLSPPWRVSKPPCALQPRTGSPNRLRGAGVVIPGSALRAQQGLRSGANAPLRGMVAGGT